MLQKLSETTQGVGGQTAFTFPKYWWQRHGVGAIPPNSSINEKQKSIVLSAHLSLLWAHLDNLEALRKELWEKDMQILLWENRFGPHERSINLSGNKDTPVQEVNQKRQGLVTRPHKEQVKEISWEGEKQNLQGQGNHSWSPPVNTKWRMCDARHAEL